MQSSVQSLGELARCRGAKLLGIGSLVGLSALLAAVTGCPPPVVDEPTPCTTNAECEDNQACVDGACQDVECNDNGDCDDSLVCTEDVCDAALFTCSNPPIDGCCTTNGECDEVGGETCDIPNNVCVTPECTTNAECSALDDQCNTGTCTDFACVATPVTDGTACDDGDECLDPDTCTAGACGGGTAVVCVAPDACTTASCDSATGCVETPLPDCCLDATECADLADDCNTADCVLNACEVTPANEAGACDDGEVCTDSDTCTLGVCGGTVDADCCSDAFPCPTGQTCNPTMNSCVGGELLFTALDGDVLEGSSADDTFTATLGTLQPLDIAIGNLGTDTLNASITSALSSGATLIDIDTINFTTVNNATFDAANCGSIGAFTVDAASLGGLTLENIEGGIGLGLNTGFDDTLVVDLTDDSGAADALTLTIDGTQSGAVFEYVEVDASGLETLNLVVNGSTLTSADPAVDFFGDVVETIITGAGDLTLDGCDDDLDDLEANDIDTTGLMGSLTFSTVGALGGAIDLPTDHPNVPDVANYIINDSDTGGYAHAISLNDGDVALTVQIGGLDAGLSSGTLAVTQLGDPDGNSVDLVLSGDGDGVGAVTLSNTGTFNVDSSGTAATAVGGVTLAAIVSATFDTRLVTVTGSQELDLGTVANALEINAGAFTGGLTATGDGNDSVVTGGDGADTLSGAGAIDQIDGGAGDDTISGGAGIEDVTGGTGADTFVFDTIVAAADANNIMDFVAADGDILQFDIVTFTAYTGGAITIVDTSGAPAADEVIVDLEADILLEAGGTANSIAIATDTGDIYYDANGDFTAGAVVIGNISEAEVENLTDANFSFP